MRLPGVGEGGVALDNRYCRSRVLGVELRFQPVIIEEVAIILLIFLVSAACVVLFGEKVLIKIETFLKGSGKKQRKKMENLGCSRESNPGPPLASVTSALATTTLDFQDLHTFPLYWLSSTTCCSLILNRLLIMCRQNTFSVSTGNTSPSGEEL